MKKTQNKTVILQMRADIEEAAANAAYELSISKSAFIRQAVIEKLEREQQKNTQAD